MTAEPPTATAARTHHDHWKSVRLRDVKPRGPITYLYGPLLAEGYATVLYGPGSVGKSTFAAAVAVAIASGRETIATWAPAPGPVLILDFETDESAWELRARQIAAGAGMQDIPADIHYVNPTQDLVQGRDALAEMAATIRPRLLIVDSTGFALGQSNEESDPKNGVLAMHNVLKHLNTTTLVLDHLGRNGRIYGSIYKINAPREVFAMTKTTTGFGLNHIKTNLRERLRRMDVRVEFSPGHGPISYSVSTNQSRDSVRAQVFAHLKENPTLANAELLRLTGGTPNAVRTAKSAWRRLSGVTRVAA